MSVSIIGCGWLGQALAQHLLEKNVQVIASYQSEASRDTLFNLGICAAQLILPLPKNILNFKQLASVDGVEKQLFQQKTMIIAIPPQLKRGRVDYPLKIKQLVHLAQLGNTKHIILLNSTAIYNGLAGEVSEGSELAVNADKVASLLAAEQALNGFSKRVHILRLAGLVGPNRHPGKFLQAKRTFSDASAPVNLVHQTDVINILDKLIHQEITNECKTIYNVVSNTNCQRQQYYQVAAQSLNLPVPTFAKEASASTGKKVIGNRLRNELSYQFYHDDLLTWIRGSCVT